VLLIGSKYSIASENSADSILLGIRKMLLAINGRSPRTKVVLVGLLTRGFGLFEAHGQKV